MPPLPVISGQVAIKAFQKAGWQVVRRKGSHIALIKPDERSTLSIPDHKELDCGTLRSLIRKAGITVEDFIGYL